MLCPFKYPRCAKGDAVLTDVVLPDENAFDVIPRIKKLRPNLPIIVMSAQNTIMTAITAAERGAYDYLPKPFDLNALVQTVGRALEQSSKPSVSQTKASASENLPIVGRSPAMQDIYRIIARLTQTDLTVMIVGKSGTGKELVARALHDYGRRRKGAFVAVNMAGNSARLHRIRTLRPRGAPSPAPPSPNAAASSRPRAEPSSSTKSATSNSAQTASPRSRKANLRPWAKIARSKCAFSLPPP